MTDRVSATVRSRIMSKVCHRNTSPERVVRSLLHRAGFRFRLHDRRLPGRPDIVLPRYQTAIFVHGCFWHQHPSCPKARKPTSNTEFWNGKLDANVRRDERKAAQLNEFGWRVVTLWECEIRSQASSLSGITALIADLEREKRGGATDPSVHSPLEANLAGESNIFLPFLATP
jgi:DNA mismatch endonuclease, patch repair protein